MKEKLLSIKNKIRRFYMLIAFIVVALAGITSGLIEAYKYKYKIGRYK